MRIKNKSWLVGALLFFWTPMISSRVYASDFMDSRITFTFSDDNVLQGPQNTNPASPSIPNFIGSQNNTQFYDNYDTRFTGFETMTHLSLFKKMPSFSKRMDTEAGLVVRAMVMGDATVSFADSGSFIRLIFPLGEDKAKRQVNLVAFPVSSDRFRAGYSYGVSWGGSSIFAGPGIVPGLKLTLIQPKWYSFLGAKTAVRQRNQKDGTREMDTVWGVLGGAGVDVTPHFTLEANGGFFDRGTIDKREVRTQSLYGFGATAQAALQYGLPIGTSIDFQLYRNDQDIQTKFFMPEVYDNKLSWVLKSEFTLLGQNLQNVEKPTATKIQMATAGDINFSAKYRLWRFHADFVYRSLAFILFNVPSNPSYSDFPKGTRAEPEFFFAAGFDYFFQKYHLTPAFKIGIQRPAYYRGASNLGNNAPSVISGVQTFVFRDSINVDILDPNHQVVPIFATTGTLKWDISEIVSAIAQVLVRYDRNRTTYKQDPDGVNVVRSYLPPWSLGFNLMLQARF